MSNQTAEIPRLVTAPREAYLRQNETRIRSQASNLLASGNPDPAITRHLAAIEMAEDLFDIHDIASDKHRHAGNHAWSKIHARHAQAGTQFRLYHLDQLSHIVGF